MSIGVKVVRIFDQVAADDQQAWPRVHVAQLVDRQIEATDVDFVRIAAIEADVKIGDLRNQQLLLLLIRRQEGLSPAPEMRSAAALVKMFRGMCLRGREVRATVAAPS